MNIETLRIFCDVVQHQSFSRGAGINGVSQSAATQSVQRVEEHFAMQLVDRTKRPFVLTPEGQACYEGFREVLELFDSVEARVRALRMEISGLVRVAAIYSVGLHDMRPLHAGLHATVSQGQSQAWSISGRTRFSMR